MPLLVFRHWRSAMLILQPVLCLHWSASTGLPLLAQYCARCIYGRKYEISDWGDCLVRFRKNFTNKFFIEDETRKCLDVPYCILLYLSNFQEDILCMKNVISHVYKLVLGNVLRLVRGLKVMIFFPDFSVESKI